MEGRTLIRDLQLDLEVTLAGWITTARDLGKLKFIYLRDLTGEVACTIKDKPDLKVIKGNFAVLTGCMKHTSYGSEFVVSDIVDMSTGAYSALDFNDEELKLSRRIEYIKYDMKHNLKLRSDVLFHTMNFFNRHMFTYITTPVLTFESETGAKPFRIKDSDLCLAQSPQIYKQFLITAGVERYFQLAPCFRNEDKRSDRQFEFVQLDFELAFTSEGEIQSLVNEWLNEVCNLLGRTYSLTKLTYDQAVNDYGTDKPFVGGSKLRFSDGTYSFNLVSYPDDEVLARWKTVLDGFGCKFSIKDNVAYLSTSSVAKAGKALSSFMRMTNTEKKLNFCWIEKFNLFELGEDGKLSSVHHPFTAFEGELNDSNKLYVKSRSFDLVLNGVEVGGGSIRINSRTEQEKVFSMLEVPASMLKFTKLFDNPVPEHGGMAIGFDRLMSELLSTVSIRDVTAFPRNSGGIGFLEKE